MVDIKDILDVLCYSKGIVSRQARRQAMRVLAKRLTIARLSLFDFVRVWWEYRKIK